MVSYSPTAPLARHVMQSPPSVRLSVCLFPFQLLNQAIYDLKLLHVYKSWPQLSWDWRSRSEVKGRVRASVRHAVSGTSIVSRWQYSSGPKVRSAHAAVMRWTLNHSCMYRGTRSFSWTSDCLHRFTQVVVCIMKTLVGVTATRTRQTFYLLVQHDSNKVN